MKELKNILCVSEELYGKMLELNIRFAKLMGYRLRYVPETSEWELLGLRGDPVVPSIIMADNTPEGEYTAWEALFEPDEDGFRFLPDMCLYGGMQALMRFVLMRRYTIEVTVHFTNGRHVLHLALFGEGQKADGDKPILEVYGDEDVPVDALALDLLLRMVETRKCDITPKMIAGFCASLYRSLGAPLV